MKNDKRELKVSIEQFKKKLSDAFTENASITHLTIQLVQFIDQVLQQLFKDNQLDTNHHFCLLALGSYGRSELQLHSDIDILLLHSESVEKSDLQRAQTFIRNCWDLGLDISHQITTVAACAELASQNLSVISSIMDMRMLCGSNLLMDELRYQTHPLNIWPSHEFFLAKEAEQKQRYKKYGETAYNLEPNVKYGPGGLRDLQVLLAINKREFGTKTLTDSIHRGFINEKEYEELLACQHFLWRVRFALHKIAGKPEERLLFDHQVKLAALFGFEDNSNSLGIEQFMKAYFKIIKRSRELNEMLLQWFAESVIYRQRLEITPLDSQFQLVNRLIEVKNPRLFLNKPEAMLELFLWLAKDSGIMGLRASTIRLLKANSHRLDQRLRQNAKARELFLALFNSASGPYNALHHMNRYGVLAHYLDCFAAVTGQMQYDLFHVYTVDQHTLFVIRNLERFLNPDYASAFSLAAKLMPKVKKRNILYLAALFHDIAKGRGGDHSELGANEAALFAKAHQLSEEDTHLLTWLVKQHLLLSQTAHRQDIHDPKTIEQFCAKIPGRDYLDYLYLLTVADICATNHTLWNAWKDSLLKELYHAATTAMKKERELLDSAQLIQLRKEKALHLLTEKGVAAEKIQRLWSDFKGNYFLNNPPEVIADHSIAILDCHHYPLIRISPHHSHGGTEVLIYMPHRDERFTITTTILSNHRTTIQEASILTCRNHFDLDTYIILDEQHNALLDKNQIEEIQKDLGKELMNKTQLPAISQRRQTRTQAHFKLQPQVHFLENNRRQQSSLFLITRDRPGLLAEISRVLLREKIHLHNAKIATAGERVEDMFFITNQSGLPLTEEEQANLRLILLDELTA